MNIDDSVFDDQPEEDQFVSEDNLSEHICDKFQ